ncbi:MAG: dihydropteroate synthase, partial [Nitrospinota bacterium]|nr:dihydropteroate synthase [Nitrospinota bacterium]
MPKAGKLQPREYRYKRFRFSFGGTLVMGIVNVTPDSFSDGGKFRDPAAAAAHAIALVEHGADIIDIGGESSRPGAAPATVEEELARVIPVIRSLAKAIPDVPISIDTYKPVVAQAALAEGVAMINDISGLRDQAMGALAANSGAPVVVTHMKGTPQNMQNNPTYNDVVAEVKAYFEERIGTLTRMGVEKIILDPGIGFGKTANHNLQLLNRLEEIVALGYPVLVGLSRKSFIGKALGDDNTDRETGGVAANAISISKGARIIRVHDAA